jgi:hypothetical protein
MVNVFAHTALMYGRDEGGIAYSWSISTCYKVLIGRLTFRLVNLSIKLDPSDSLRPDTRADQLSGAA